MPTLPHLLLHLPGPGRMVLKPHFCRFEPYVCEASKDFLLEGCQGQGGGGGGAPGFLVYEISNLN